jgi:hypothetical protein
MGFSLNRTEFWICLNVLVAEGFDWLGNIMTLSDDLFTEGVDIDAPIGGGTFFMNEWLS